MRLRKLGLAVVVTLIEIFLAYWAFVGQFHLCFMQPRQICRWPVVNSILTIPILLFVTLVVSLTIIIRKVR